MDESWKLSQIFCDAHYNLADTLEQVDRFSEARGTITHDPLQVRPLKFLVPAGFDRALSNGMPFPR